MKAHLRVDNHYYIIIEFYDEWKWPAEAAVRLIQYLIGVFGVEQFLKAKFGGNKKYLN